MSIKVTNAHIYVGSELVGLIDGTDESVQRDAQKIANAWPKDLTVLQIGKSKRIVKAKRNVEPIDFKSEARQPRVDTTICERQPRLERHPR